MGTASNGLSTAPTGNRVPHGTQADTSGPTQFAVAVRALFRPKPIENFAVRCGVSRFTVKHWLQGDRKPSPVAIAVIVDEITREFR